MDATRFCALWFRTVLQKKYWRLGGLPKSKVLGLRGPVSGVCNFKIAAGQTSPALLN